MSLIGKNPFVNEVLTSCSAEQLTSLSALINNLGSPTVIKLKELKNTDKGVKYASVFLDDFTLVHGLWIYTDTKCGLFAFQNGFDEMQAIRIDTVNKNYEYVYQHLSVTEFRSTLDDVANSSGGGSGDKTYLYVIQFKRYLREYHVRVISKEETITLDFLKSHVESVIGGWAYHGEGGLDGTILYAVVSEYTGHLNLVVYQGSSDSGWADVEDNFVMTVESKSEII